MAKFGETMNVLEIIPLDKMYVPKSFMVPFVHDTFGKDSGRLSNKSTAAILTCM